MNKITAGIVYDVASSDSERVSAPEVSRRLPRDIALARAHARVWDVVRPLAEACQDDPDSIRGDYREEDEGVVDRRNRL